MVTYHIFIFSKVYCLQTVAELMQYKTWEERLTRSTKILAGSTPFSEEELSSAASSFYYKLVAADKYKPKTKFNGEVTLLKATDNYVQLGEDYGLSEVNIESQREF